ncbi:MAG: hypothetical protein ACRDTR_09655 [Rubrobacter sp.]
MEQESRAGQRRPVLSEWLGYWVFVSYISGPNIDADEPTKPVKAQPEIITTSFHLESYGPLGIEVKRNAGDPTLFMSWSSVMYIQGPPPEVRAQIDRAIPNQEGTDQSQN